MAGSPNNSPTPEFRDVNYPGGSFENFIGLVEDSAARAHEIYSPSDPAFVLDKNFKLSLVMQAFLEEVDVSTRLMHGRMAGGADHFFLQTKEGERDPDPVDIDPGWHALPRNRKAWRQPFLIGHHASMAVIGARAGVQYPAQDVWAGAWPSSLTVMRNFGVEFSPEVEQRLFPELIRAREVGQLQ